MVVFVKVKIKHIEDSDTTYYNFKHQGEKYQETIKITSYLQNIPSAKNYSKWAEKLFHDLYGIHANLVLAESPRLSISTSWKKRISDSIGSVRRIDSNSDTKNIPTRHHRAFSTVVLVCSDVVWGLQEVPSLLDREALLLRK